MCIHQFNPPAPSCEPETSAGVSYPGVGRCGNCICQPRHWLLDVHVSSIGNEPVDAQLQKYAGKWILTRRLAKEPDSFRRCVFLSRPVDISFHGDSWTAPGLVWGAPSTGALWELIFDRVSPEGTAVVEWFSNRWALFAGAFYWPEERDYFDPNGPSYFNTGDNLLLSEPQIAAYVHKSWTPDDPASGRIPFRCLNPNLFYRTEGVWEGAFPLELTLSPFWP